MTEDRILFKWMKKFGQMQPWAYNIILCLVIILQCIVMIHYVSWKDGIFADELYTYESTAGLFRNEDDVTDWKNRTNILNQFHTHEEFVQNLTVMEEDELQDQTLPQIIRSLGTGRTYFVLLNFISSFQNDSLNLWYPIGLNIFFFILGQLCLYAVCRRIYHDPIYGIAAVVLYGLSQGALLSVTYIRFYELYTLICLLHVYVHIRLLDAEKVDFYYTINVLFSILFTWIGYRNAEYMMVFSAVSAFVYLVYNIKKKRKQQFWIYFGIYGIAGIIFLWKYGRGLIASYHIETSGNQMRIAIDRLLYGDWQLFWNQLKVYSKVILENIGIPSVFILGIFLAAIVYLTKRKYYIENYGKWIYLLCSSGIYVIIISKISPWVAWRYVSNIFPVFFVICIGFSVFAEYSSVLKIAVLAVAIILQINHTRLVAPYLLSEWVDGPAFYVRDEINDLYRELDSICFWNGTDRGLLYYAAFLWPEGTQVYLTTVKDFDIVTEERKRALQNEELLVWVWPDQEWEESVAFLMQQQGYLETEVYDAQNGRWQIHKCVRAGKTEEN